MSCSGCRRPFALIRGEERHVPDGSPASDLCLVCLLLVPIRRGDLTFPAPPVRMVPLLAELVA